METWLKKANPEGSGKEYIAGAGAVKRRGARTGVKKGQYPQL
jgi:hypothetical protein